MKDEIKAFQSKIESRYNLAQFYIYLTRNGDIELSMIEVRREDRKYGVGSKVMEDLIEFADKNDLRIILTTSVQDSSFGTTSMSRLKKFYKRFGFVDNKGRNKDFTITANMFRIPKMKKTLKQFQESVLRYNKWRKLTDKEIDFEYMVEYPKLKRAWGDVFPTLESFRVAVRDADTLLVTSPVDRRIEYRSHTSSLDELKDLVSGYQYPRDVDRIVDGMNKGVKIPYPIVIRDGRKMRIFGGNTRMDVSFILGLIPTVLVVDVP